MANRASPASDAARLLAADPATPALADLLRMKGAIEPAQDGNRLRGDREGQGRGKSIRRAWSGRAVWRAPLSSDPPGRISGRECAEGPSQQPGSHRGSARGQAPEGEGIRWGSPFVFRGFDLFKIH